MPVTLCTFSLQTRVSGVLCNCVDLSNHAVESLNQQKCNEEPSHQPSPTETPLVPQSLPLLTISSTMHPPAHSPHTSLPFWPCWYQTLPMAAHNQFHATWIYCWGIYWSSSSSSLWWPPPSSSSAFVIYRLCGLMKTLISCFWVATLLYGLIWEPLVNWENHHWKLMLGRCFRALDYRCFTNGTATVNEECREVAVRSIECERNWRSCPK